MDLRVGILTSGGDCQGLNSAMRGVARGLFNSGENIQILGFLNGYEGLMFSNYRYMTDNDFSGILTLGGTILGTSRQPFKNMEDPLLENEPDGLTKMEAMLQTYGDLNLDALIVLGGNGTQKSANLLSQNGCNVIHLPKTIDNDLSGTERTFGFQSAVNIASDVIDAIHTTATSHGRVFIVEIMGNKVGWLTLFSGVASGADIILIPEIPYDPIAVAKALKQRQRNKKRFSIIAIAEGAQSVKEAKMTKAQVAELRKNVNSVAYHLQAQLEDLMIQEIRCCVPGHYQRGGRPSAYDRILTTQLGVDAARAVLEGDFGKMIGISCGKPIRVDLAKISGQTKKVPLDDPILLSAREIGISFGD
ncbi:MAG TPA: ATP-dependent 6-phosphofructokinase [Candidatus Eisenbacteria bacterium]|nr:ATP-dependent 6-phosphofructokinase [Candidatus Eisenbacteria bacterium]